ncbi:hypothetical protein JL101_029385 (plasmid) [Skermanella rosea]|uniref:hypothetical protein n=1 Tax=Skermanella rosea TaxID=1817965 RepID=UPI0019317085|nr:hypothetical protein [Skermanella rosea]UEM07115.1 hypothetical protein JL101_029385 [Skermanella rosea]
MMRSDLISWADQNPGRLRLFLRIDPETVPSDLRQYLMPYDNRLNDPDAYPGTDGDFAQRALADFVRNLFDPRAPHSPDEDAARIRARLALFKAPLRPVRAPATDEEIQHLILLHWEAVQGRSGMMLRKLRDEFGIACEQGRFKNLFHAVAKTRQGNLMPC